MLELMKGEILPIDFPTEAAVLKILEQKKKTEFSYIVFNFRTLVRNFLQALTPKSEVKNKNQTRLKILKSGEYRNQLYNMFTTNLDKLEAVLNDNKVKFVYYFRDHKKLQKCLNNFVPPELMNTNEQLVEKYAQSFKIPLANSARIKFSNLPRNEMGESYMLINHSTPDLVNYQYQDNVMLVESFTGDLKTWDQWYTKYHPIGKEDMSVFPFNGYLLTALGCKHYIKPGELKLRKQLLKLAKRQRWNKFTGIYKVRNDMLIKDPILHELLKKKEKCYNK